MQTFLNFYQVAVKQLYDFRDHYFEHNSTDKALLKNQETQEKLKETLSVLDYVQGKKGLIVVFTSIFYRMIKLRSFLLFIIVRILLNLRLFEMTITFRLFKSEPMK